VEVGTKFVTKTSGSCVVLEYKSCTEVLVEFSDGYRKIVRADSLRVGNVKNPYHPSVQGVGYIGEGIFVTSKNKLLTKESVVWRSVLQRCYDPKFLQRHPTYTENYVNPYFHNFQNFAEWCNNSVGFKNEGWNLDKDIILRGNKEYGPDTCAFVPSSINNLIISNRSCRGEFPIGVSFNKVRNLFIASCRIDNRQVEVGVFNDPLEAFLSYKSTKEAEIRKVANQWKQLIDPRVYESLMLWEVREDD